MRLARAITVRPRGPLLTRPWPKHAGETPALTVLAAPSPLTIAVRAFTLVEIMIVVAILGVMLGVSLPAINNARKYAPMLRTVKELQEVFSNARARAIFDGSTRQVVFRPYDRSFAVAGGGGGAAGAEGGPQSAKGAGLSGTIDDSLSLEMLDINLMEFKDQELAVVNFYPNGTCDELTIVLRSDQNEWRKITLEVTTALPTVGNVK